ncbi:CDP-glucose 4,6-dehydratase [Solimonas sp. K1W22B-7]|uniref:CDP-glucose 4,6-dehydratase n=1 Tax=Solimonas sp. K1W22B-7 TaxID=2303331 RepID=UPI000E32F805|nr:CDP-glucose 4,6-dehydratase [Solimonas sp. K1W22B-7]AXQ29908.1 CDP-glucose 4,6-dehydratase [Solimonas sp. K1W22B-7]
MRSAIPDPAFWAGRKVLLTGHTGFKGSWLSLWLQRMGADLTGFALAPETTPSLFDEAKVARGMRSVIADVRNREEFDAAIRSAQPEIIIHMAAQPLVRHSYAFPVETYATNVMGTVHLLDSVRRCESVRVVVNVTSDKCYENREWLWGYREDEPMGGYDPYSNSKGCSELVTSAFRKSYFNPAHHAEHRVALGTGRAGNVIGGGDWAADRLIPDCVRAIGEGRSVHIRNPASVRPWQHVLEPLGGYLVLAERLHRDGPAFAEGWNFGPEESDARPVEWIAQRMTERWGAGASWTFDGAPQPHEAAHLKLDCSKAHARLGWRPRWSLETAIDRIIDWHKAHLAGEDVSRICNQQIDEYLQHGH